VGFGSGLSLFLPEIYDLLEGVQIAERVENWMVERLNGGEGHTQTYKIYKHTHTQTHTHTHTEGSTDESAQRAWEEA
jgi:hypothetical protein